MSSISAVQTLVLNDPTLDNKKRRRILAAIEDKPEEWPDVMLSRQQTAELLGVCVATVRRYQRAGKLKGIYLSKRTVRYSKKQVLELTSSGIANLEGGDS